MVSMCPYKWALYALSLWAAVYALIEAAVAFRDMHAVVKPGYQPGPVEDDSEEEEEEVRSR